MERHEGAKEVEPGHGPESRWDFMRFFRFRGKCGAEAARLRGRFSNTRRDKHRIALKEKKKKISLSLSLSLSLSFSRAKKASRYLILEIDDRDSFHALALSRVRARSRGERLAQMYYASPFAFQLRRDERDEEDVPGARSGKSCGPD